MDHAFCGHCGQPLGTAAGTPATAGEDGGRTAPEAAERRQLTVLFCDLVGSTELSARLDPEEYREALGRYHAAGDAVIARHEGHVAQHLGDGLLAYFGWPRASDDAAECAVRAALDIVAAAACVLAEGQPLSVRVGVHTGEVVISELGVGARQETVALGTTPNIAARLQTAARAGEVLISAATYRLVAGLFVVEGCGRKTLKGIADPVEVYRVVQSSGLRGRLAAAAMHGLTPFVDRIEERQLLRGRFERACDGDGQVVMLIGEAGIGKSRLAQVLREDLVDTPHTWLETGGAPQFAHTPFYAIAQLLAQLVDTDPPAPPAARAERLAEVLGDAGLDVRRALPLVAPLLEIPLPAGYEPVSVAPDVARKRLVATLAAWVFGSARRQPLVILLDDLQWVDPSTLELQHLLVEQSATERVLLLYTARPEFVAPWPLRAHHTTLTLNRLRGRYARDLVSGVAARSSLLAELIDEVVARTDGVPLFLEELTKTVIETGAAAMREIPSTLADSLMARLDRLGREAKEVAQIAAICGRDFSYDLLAAVHPVPDAQLGAALQQLRDAELLYEHGQPPQATYTFKHALVHETAYGSLLKSRRRALHAQVATVIAERLPRVAELRPEVLAQHYQNAGQAELASAAWRRAGERASERGAHREAAHYLEAGIAALEAVPEGAARDSEEFTLQLALAKALSVIKGPAAAETAAALARGFEIGARLAEPQQLVAILMGLAMTTLYREGPAAARPLTEQAATAAERAGLATFHALARCFRGVVLYHAAEFAAALDELTGFLSTYDDADAPPLPFDPVISAHTYRAKALFQLGRCDQARAEIQAAVDAAARAARPSVQVIAAYQAAEFYSLLREPREARLHAERVLNADAEGRSPMSDGIAGVTRGWALAEEGQIADGLAAARAGLAAAISSGHRPGLELHHALLAEVLARAGDVAEALRVLGEGELICPSAVADRALTLAVRADLLAAHDTSAAAEAAYVEALTWARGHGAKSFELRIAASYARWLHARGRDAEAHRLLGGVCATVGEGLDTRDAVTARGLLADLGADGSIASALTPASALERGMLRTGKRWPLFAALVLCPAACAGNGGGNATTPTAPRAATNTPTPSGAEATATPTSAALSPSATGTTRSNPTATATASPSDTASPTASPSVLTSSTATPTDTPRATSTTTPTRSPSSTPSSTPTPTSTPSPTNPVLNRPPDSIVALGVPGGPTYVAFDSLGMPHIYGPDLNSVIYVQGYETAKARFWQMDAFRRVAEGRLSELFGTATLSMDVEMRTVFTTRDGRRLEQELWERVQRDAPDLAATAQAYAAGINAWLADLRAGRNGAILPPEYTLVGVTAQKLADWRPQDTLAIARLQAYSLSETLEQELFAAEVAMSSLPEAVQLDVFRSAPAAPATVLPVGGTMAAGSRVRTADLQSSLPPQPPIEVLHSVRTMLEENARFNPFAGSRGVRGSNNWIVSPQLSENGFAMLANDPHLQLFNPGIWHMVQLDSGGDMRVTGVNFPGLPGVILGHNEFGAWGATVSNFDVTDIYVEQVTTPSDYPNSPRTVLFNGQQIPVLRIVEEFGMPTGTTSAVIEVVPHHGPMVPDPNLKDDVVGLAATNMSFRWTGHEITLDSRFLTELNQAHNVAEFKGAVRDFAVGGQNWVWADINGDIAYFPYVLVPQRPQGTIPYLPMDGTGSAEWRTDASGNTAWLPEEEFPQAVNPPQGFLATANNDQLGYTLDNDPLNDPVYFAYTDDIGFREQRIQDMLSNRAGLRPAGAKISLADMSAYQYDTVSLEASRLVPFLLLAADARADLVTPAMQAALDRLRNWGSDKPGFPAWSSPSGVDPASERQDFPSRGAISSDEIDDSIAASIYAAWVTRLSQAVFTDDFAGTGIAAPGDDFGTKALLHILEDIDNTDPNFIVHTKGANGESTLWDDKTTADAVETRDQIMLRALADGLAFLQELVGSAQPQDWLWGKIHRVAFQHFFGQAGIQNFNIGNIPAPGNRFTVNVASYDLNAKALGDFVFMEGPSQRFVAVLDPAGIHSVNSLPGGENGNPCAGLAPPQGCGLNPMSYNHINPANQYGDHIPDWVNGQTFDYRVSRDAVAADTRQLIEYTTTTP